MRLGLGLDGPHGRAGAWQTLEPDLSQRGRPSCAVRGIPALGPCLHDKAWWDHQAVSVGSMASDRSDSFGSGNLPWAVRQRPRAERCHLAPLGSHAGTVHAHFRAWAMYQPKASTRRSMNFKGKTMLFDGRAGLRALGTGMRLRIGARSGHVTWCWWTCSKTRWTRPVRRCKQQARRCWRSDVDVSDAQTGRVAGASRASAAWRTALGVLTTLAGAGGLIWGEQLQTGNGWLGVNLWGGAWVRLFPHDAGRCCG